MMNQKGSLGKLGEALATDFLIKHNHSIIGANYYSSFGEIDIIAIKANKLKFIEVKTRKNPNVRLAENSISLSKQKKIANTAMHFLSKNPQYSQYDCSFDVIIIISYPEEESYKVIYQENAFIPECF